MSRRFEHLDYFPSYEIIVGPHSAGHYFEDDLRGIKPAGVAHAMRVFLGHYAGGASGPRTPVVDVAPQATGLVCDEEFLQA